MTAVMEGWRRDRERQDADDEETHIQFLFLFFCDIMEPWTDQKVDQDTFKRPK